MKRVLAFLSGLLIGALQAHAEPAVDAITRIVVPVSNLNRAVGFYTEALSFAPIDAGELPGVALRLGGETIELVQRTGRRVPADSRSNDRWSQHLAIVVSDIGRACAMSTCASPEETRTGASSRSGFPRCPARMRGSRDCARLPDRESSFSTT